jgi:hypothetical protein
MTEERAGARALYVVLALVSVGALVGVAALYLRAFDDADRRTFRLELGKGLVQVFTVAVIGSVVKLLIDDHQHRLQVLSEARVRAEDSAAQELVRAQQHEERLESFRTDKVKRLVSVTNVLRRAPVLIDAHRSAKTYNEQMRAIIDAALELRLIRHEIDALGAESNAAFAQWPEGRDSIRKMEKYIGWIVSDFRTNSKEASELQRRAETDRTLQPTVWQRIQGIDSVRDLLQEVDTGGEATRYAQEYLVAYGHALEMMIAESLSVPSPTVNTVSAAPAG